MIMMKKWADFLDPKKELLQLRAASSQARMAIVLRFAAPWWELFVCARQSATPCWLGKSGLRLSVLCGVAIPGSGGGPHGGGSSTVRETLVVTTE